MKNLIDECDLQIEPKYKIIKKTVESVAKMICGFCEGVGHHAGVCASKKKMDKLTNDAGIRAEWGKIKSGIIKQNVQISEQVKKECGDLRTRAQTRINDTARDERARVMTSRRALLLQASPQTSNVRAKH